MERQFWTREEISALLTIWAENGVQTRIDGASRNEDVMEFIVAELEKSGIKRTTSQVREKLKKLRAEYKYLKAHSGKGGPKKKKKFSWFEVMDSVLGHRHTTSEVQVRDSTVLTTEGVYDELSNALGSLPPHDVPSTGKSGEAEATFSALSSSTPDSRKRKASSVESREFLACMREVQQDSMEREARMRRQELQQEALMRREELQHDRELRREEMELRRAETQMFVDVFRSLSASFVAPATLTAPEEGPATSPHPEPVINGEPDVLPQAARSESRKGKASSVESREFLACMREVQQDSMEREARMRRQELQQEALMRREELQHDRELRREEMELRRAETQMFVDVFRSLVSAVMSKT